MIAIPAIDLRGGVCVLPAGSIGSADRFLPNPADATRLLAQHGFTRVHIVDLDAASGHGSNDLLMRDTIRTAQLDVQAGGGLRDPDGVQDALDSGARWAVVASRAIPHLDAIADLVSLFPGEIILSVALRERRVEVDRWPRSLPVDVLDLVVELSDVPLAAILLRATEREGRLGGPDFRLVEDAVDDSAWPILVSGGIGTIGHLRSLEDRGAAGVVIGTALHNGMLNAAAVAWEFPS